MKIRNALGARSGVVIPECAPAEWQQQPNNSIVGTSSTNLLTKVNNTIEGAGNIGGNSMALINQSVINATAGAGQNVLYIQTSDGTTNTGTLEATVGSTLSLFGNAFTNTGGTI